MNKTTCRRCGAAIVFIRTKSGKSMPCDAAPVWYWPKENGLGRVVTPDGEVVCCEFEGKSRADAGIGFLSHFSTCPQAGAFKKRKDKKRVKGVSGQTEFSGTTHTI